MSFVSSGASANIDTDLFYIKGVGERILRAVNNEDINYVVTGDSTRAASYINMKQYYEDQLTQLNITVDYNSEVGMETDKWITGGGTASLAQAITQIPGTGKNTILEWSMGINDWQPTPNNPGFNGADPVQTVIIDAMQEAFDALLAAKPDLNIFLVTPSFTDRTEAVEGLKVVYQALAETNNFHLVDIQSMMSQVHPSPLFYQDTVHQNEHGGRRILNYILDNIVPSGVTSSVRLPQLSGSGELPRTELFSGVTVISGYWSTSHGGFNSHANWRCIDVAVVVEQGLKYRWNNLGGIHQVIFYTSGGSFISTVTAETVTGETYRTFTAPLGAGLAKFNLSATGDVAGTPSLVKHLSNNILTIDEINEGNIIKMFPKITSAGASGSYTAQSGETVTVLNGLITSIT